MSLSFHQSARVMMLMDCGGNKDNKEMRDAFRSQSLPEAVLDGVHNGFPEVLRELAWKPENVRQ